MHRLKSALEAHGWDGDWYRRAYFDDGTPLGSVANAECRIDSIAQSWGVLSGAAEPARASRAMAAVEEYLVRRGQELILLFTPPFDRSAVEPGYVKGYPPWSSRERRAVHARRDLGRDGVRRARRRRQGERALLDSEPHQPSEHARRRAPVQGGALRHRGRRLRRAPPHRPRRVDVVHGVRRVDVSGRDRVAPRVPAPRHEPASRPVHPAGMARIRDSRSGTTRRSTKSRSRTRRASRAASRRWRWTGTASTPPAGSCPCPTTARGGGSGWSSDREEQTERRSPSAADVRAGERTHGAPRAPPRAGRPRNRCGELCQQEPGNRLDPRPAR